MDYTCTVYDVRAENPFDDDIGGPAMIEVETIFRDTEQECLEWADAMGFMNHPDYEIIIEDIYGTRRTVKS